MSGGQPASDDTYRRVCEINNFRNDYVAHQKKELLDPVVAKVGLKTWALGLADLWRLHNELSKQG